MRLSSKNAAKHLQEQWGCANRTGIAARSHLGIELVPIADVRYFKAAHKYVTMHHISGAAVINETLRGLEAEFRDRLLRVHRNTLIAIKHVVGLERSENSRSYDLKLADVRTPIRVSRRRAAAVRRALRAPPLPRPRGGEAPDAPRLDGSSGAPCG